MRTVTGHARTEVEIKRSRFIAHVARVDDLAETLAFFESVSDPSATHNCWAWKLGQQYRFNDDGEPASTAGKPIYAAIEGKGLDHVMVVVTRYFGGIKLGAGGLVRAYGGTAASCLRQAPRIEVRPRVRLRVEVAFADLGILYRHLERHPEHRFHPIFKWFMEWCDDEFRHGEAFALIMRANPQLLRGVNVWWIRFFLLAVYSTMYVRDHTRPQLYEALGMDPTEFDFKVFDITTAISRQIFPLTLDTDNPKFRRGLERLREINIATQAAKQRGGVLGKLKQAGLSANAALVFARLYVLPTKPNQLPENVRMAPAW